MSFNIANFSWWRDVNVDQRVYFYDADSDNMAATQGAGYFNSLAGTIRNGDMIAVEASNGKYFAIISTNFPTLTVGVSTLADCTSFNM